SSGTPRGSRRAPRRPGCTSPGAALRRAHGSRWCCVSRKKKPATGLIWRWLDAVEAAALADDGPDRPTLGAIMLVRQRRARTADPNGGSCYPSQAWIAERTGLKRDTIRGVDRWLQERELMKPVRRVGKGGSIEYRLRVPDGVHDVEDTPEVDPDGGQVPPP